jgi:hypothetical protein
MKPTGKSQLAVLNKKGEVERVVPLKRVKGRGESPMQKRRRVQKQNPKDTRAA